jgi:3-hydroxy-9,10-secoandrosta-1,3,5(10)-triene-9,17-dione monooxygenase
MAVQPKATTTVSGTTKAELVERAASLVPALRNRAAQTEQLRRIPDENLADFRDTGLLQVGNPARYGGHPGVDYDTTFEILMQLARGCGSSAWCYAVWTVHNWLIGFFPLQAQEEYYATGPHTLCSSSYDAKKGRAEPEPGGYRLTGHWDFSSGCDAATWFMAGATTPAGPRFFLLPMAECEVIDTWFVSGLAGTGSKDIVVRDVFVPEHRMLDAEAAGTTDMSAWDLHQQTSYRVPMRVILGWELAAPIIGLGEAALEDFVGRIRGTTGRARSAEGVQMQLRLAEAAAEVRSAGLLHKSTVQEVLAKGERGETFSTLERARYVRDKAFVVKLCVQAVNRLFDVSGGRALYLSQHIQRIHRDTHALSHRDGFIIDFAGEAWGREVLNTDGPVSSA